MTSSSSQRDLWPGDDSLKIIVITEMFLSIFRRCLGKNDTQSYSNTIQDHSSCHFSCSHTKRGGLYLTCALAVPDWCQHWILHLRKPTQSQSARETLHLHPWAHPLRSGTSLRWWCGLCLERWVDTTWTSCQTQWQVKIFHWDQCCSGGWSHSISETHSKCSFILLAIQQQKTNVSCTPVEVRNSRV